MQKVYPIILHIKIKYKDRVIVNEKEDRIITKENTRIRQYKIKKANKIKCL